MAKRKPRPYRLRIVDGMNKTYIVRSEGGHVAYKTASEVPLALSNLLLNEAAETRFKLEDALDGSEARGVLLTALRRAYKNSMIIVDVV